MKPLIFLLITLAMVACKQQNTTTTQVVDTQRDAIEINRFNLDAEISTYVDKQLAYHRSTVKKGLSSILPNEPLHKNKAANSYFISSDKDTILLCEEGTQLKIEANSFVLKGSKSKPAAPIEIRVAEYYTLPDILLAELSTRTKNGILETGGMIHVKAYANNKELELASGRKLGIAFSNEFRKEDMKLFNGKKDRNGEIIWQEEIEETNQYVEKTIPFTIVDNMPDFPGGANALMEFLAANTSYPQLALETGIQGTVFVNFVVRADGEIVNERILRGIGGGCDEEALRVVKLMPKWAPGSNRGKRVDVEFNLPMKFILSGGGEPFEYSNSTNFDTIFNTFNNKQDSIKSVKRYVSPTEIKATYFLYSKQSELGFYNLDRYYKNPNTQPKQLAFKMSKSGNVNIKAILNNQTIILNAYEYERGQFRFSSIPYNTPFTFVAIKFDKDKTFLLKEENCSASNRKPFAIKEEWKEVSDAELMEELREI